MSTATLTGQQRVNAYPGMCVKCSTRVKDGEGVIFRSDSNARWQTFCRNHAPLPLGMEEAKKSEAELKRQRRTLEADGSLWTPREFSNVCRAFPVARWDAARICWTVSTSDGDLPRVIALCKQHGISYPPAFDTRIKTQEEESIEDGAPIDPRLYPFQREGVLFLRRKRRALLGDAMGLGKTNQALSALPTDARTIVVCPASLKLNWAKEVRIWRPDLTPIVLSGRQKKVPVPRPRQVLIVNYDVLPPESAAEKMTPTEGAAIAETFLVFDECQKMKNYKSIRHKRGKSLASLCGSTWLLTGTPMMNRPPDLKGILDVGGLFRDVFGSWSNFLRCFDASKNRWGGTEYGMPSPVVPELLRKVMLRRLTEEVLPDLPEKRYQDIPVELEDEDDADRDRDLRALRDDLDAAWDLHGERIRKGSLPPFEEFSEIRASLAKAKIPAMLEQVEEFEENEEPVLVFSAHRAPVEECGKRPGWGVIYGDTPKDRRHAIVEAFQAGRLKGVALTIQAGGEGLTLTRGRTSLFVDLDWTPALNSQAEARNRRIGSEKGHVTYRRLVCDHPLEQHIHALLTEKIHLHAASIDHVMETPTTVNAPLPPPVVAETDEEFAARLERVAREDAEREERQAEEDRKRAERLAVSRLESEAAYARNQEERERLRKEASKRRAEMILARERGKLHGMTLPELTEERAQAVREAVAYLASVCDGAMAKDGRGFNKPDASMGHVLAHAGLEEGSPALEAAYMIVRRYPGQVKDRWPILWSGSLSKEDSA